MKARISRGEGFRGLLEYLYGPGENKKPGRAQMIGGNLVGDNPKDLSAEFKVSRKLRPEAKKPVWHSSLSLPPGENLSDSRWAKIAEDYLLRMDIDPNNHQWHLVRHNDTDHEHVHLVVSRIGLDGRLWLGRNDVKKAIRTTQELEIVHGLMVTPGLSKTVRKAMSRKEVQRAKRTGKIPARIELQAALDSSLSDCPDFKTFIARLDAQGVSLRPNGKSGTVGGVSFSNSEKITFKGSQLGKKYTWKQIAIAVAFDQTRDAELIRHLRGKAARDKAMEGQVATIEGTPGQVPQPQEKAQRTLDLAFKQQDDSYVWKNHPSRIAIVDNGQSITVCSRRESACKAAIQLVAQKGWESLQINSVDQVKALELFRQARLQGFPRDNIEMTGYQPTVAEINTIEEEVMQGGKNRRNQKASSFAGEKQGQERRRIIQDNRGDLGTPERDDDRHCPGPGINRQNRKIDSDRKSEALPSNKKTNQKDMADSSINGDPDSSSHNGMLSDLATPADNTRKVGGQMVRDVDTGRSKQGASTGNADEIDEQAGPRM